MHLLSFLLQLLVDFIESDASLVNLLVALFAHGDSIVQCRLVQAGKEYVSDLVHCEHARLLESL